MSISMPSTSFSSERLAPQPPCPECTVALHPVGSGRHLYWSCRWCGTTMPRH